MSPLFQDVKGELGPELLEILLAMYDFKNPELKEILEHLKFGQKSQFFEFEKSEQARRLREYRVAHLPFVDFLHLPDVLDDDMLDKVYEYYKIKLLWKGVNAMVKPEQFAQIAGKVSAVQSENYKKKRDAMTDEDKQREAAQWKKILEDPTPRFYGNMGQPETPEEWERKFRDKIE